MTLPSIFINPLVKPKWHFTGVALSHGRIAVVNFSQLSLPLEHVGCIDAKFRLNIGQKYVIKTESFK